MSTLKKRHRIMRQNQRLLEKSKEQFLASIRDARANGWTYQRIADELDISVSRVQQLVRQSDGRGRSNR